VSAQQALKQHNIPLTSLVSRVLDIRAADEGGSTDVREAIVRMCLRYLQADTLLCWAPERSIHEPDGTGRESLRTVQMRVAKDVIAYLTTRVWPGVEIQPVLDSDSIVPAAQPDVTISIVRGWLTGLPAFELAGVERAALAGKSLLAAVRLVAEWSEALTHLRQSGRPSERFGIDEAVEACTLEVRWQTEQWGEVEDTHDVEKEDLRRQFGSVILLVHGEKA
jgi:chaperone required for assembly of F1-ATPase